MNRPPAPTDQARRLAALATAHNLFTWDQARTAGYTRYQIRKRVLTGAWISVLGPVLAPAGVPITPTLYDRALALAVPTAVLAGPSAARIHRMPVPDDGQYFLLRAGRRRTPPRARLLRGSLPPADITVADRLPVTTRARTVFDCVWLLPAPAAIDLLATALDRGWISWADFGARARAWAGQPGTARLAALTGDTPTSHATTVVPPFVPPRAGGTACARCGHPSTPADTTSHGVDPVTLTLVTHLPPWRGGVPARTGRPRS